ncbi:HAD family hydrolase [Kitasatospora acidiphila]|uniref:HAD family hydrolase n=1 Tax=Kitasatospora acidiphila TaxID=2567942 RepID=UPI001E525F2A|nr:HAD family hydrolase [Kitasatospora acidiphila]
MAKRLVLWDVDHTLIATRGVGHEAFAAAFERVTGRPLEKQAEITGRSELAILRETLVLHGLPRDLVDFQEYTEILASEYLRRAGELRERGHALPGAAAALGTLASLPGVVQTAATGNVRSVAEIKLQTFGLDRHIDFEVGGYGEDAEVRADMVRVALRRAGVEPNEAIIFGDTVADVEAGLATGVFAVAVATGRTSAAELTAAGADRVLLGLEETAVVAGLVCDLPS